MIETHDQQKPGNLANSAVLKMLEEEEHERVYPVNHTQNERKSRPRQRRQVFIDRDTVLKINRRPPYHYRRNRRDFSWPPPPPLPPLSSSESAPDDKSRSRCCSEEIHFDDRICKRHEIFHLKEMFDRGIIDENKENISRTLNHQKNISNKDYKILLKQEQQQQQQQQQQKSHDANIINSQNNNNNNNNNVRCSCNIKDKMKFYDRIECTSPIIQNDQEWPPKCTTMTTSDIESIISNRTYYLPETELHNIGIVEPKRKYFERAASSSPDRHKLHEYYHNDNKKSILPSSSTSVLRRWKSNENMEIEQGTNIKHRNYKIYSKEDDSINNQIFLQRYKSNSYNELPPLKPKREYHKNVQFSTNTKNKLNLNNLKSLMLEDKAMSQQNVRDERKFHDENLNSYSTDDKIVYPKDMCKDCLKILLQLNSQESSVNTNKKLFSSSDVNEKIDNYDINKNKFDPPAAKIPKFNLNDINNAPTMQYEKISKKNFYTDDDDATDSTTTTTTTTTAISSPFVNTTNEKRNANDIEYRYCVDCSKITSEYEEENILKPTISTVNYDLAKNTKYDAKNICSHNLSVKINENVNNISKNNCICCDGDGHHRFHHFHACTHRTTKKPDGNHDDDDVDEKNNFTIIEKEKQNGDNNTIKNIQHQKKQINNKTLPETTENDEKHKKNITMGVVVTSMTNLPSSTLVTASVTSSATKTISASETGTGIPAIITTRYRDTKNSELKEKSTAVSVQSTSREALSESIDTTCATCARICDENAHTYQSVMADTVNVIKGNNDNDGSQGNQKPKRDENLQTTFGKQENIASNIRRRQEDIFKDTNENEKKYDHEIMGLSTVNDKKKWRHGIYFTDGEYVWGPYEKWPFNEEPPSILKKRIEELFVERNSTTTDDVNVNVDKQIEKNNNKNDVSVSETTTTTTTVETDEEMSLHQIDTNVSQYQNQSAAVDHKVKESSTTSCESKNLSEEQISEADEDLNIENLLEQRKQIQKSITEDLRRIDEYMETAEQAINDAEEQISEPSIADNILVYGTPLQTVIRDIFRKCLSPSPTNKIPPIPPVRKTISYISPKMPTTVSIVENTPVVEHVLLDLYNLSMAFDTLNNLTVDTAMGNNFLLSHSTGYVKDYGNSTNKTQARITEIPIVVNNDDDDNNNDVVVVANDADNIGRDEVTLSTTASPHSLCEETLGSVSESDDHNNTNSNPSIITMEEDESSTTTTTTATTTATTSPAPTHIDKIIHSKNILSGFLITKQNQEEAFTKAGLKLLEHSSPVIDFNKQNKSVHFLNTTTFAKENSSVIDDLTNEKSFQSSMEIKTNNNDSLLNIDFITTETNKEILLENDSSIEKNKFSQNLKNPTHTLVLGLNLKTDDYVGNNDDDNNIKTAVKTENESIDVSKDQNKDNNDNHSNDLNKKHKHIHDEMIYQDHNKVVVVVQQSKVDDNQLHFVDNGQMTTNTKYAKLTSSQSSYDDDDDDVKNKSSDDTMNKDDKLMFERENNNNNNTNDVDDDTQSYSVSYSDVKHKAAHGNSSYSQDNNKKIKLMSYEGTQRKNQQNIVTFDVDSNNNNKQNSKLISMSSNQNEQKDKNCDYNQSNHRSRRQQQQQNNHFNQNSNNRIRSISQPPPLKTLSPHLLIQIQNENESKDNNFDFIQNQKNNDCDGDGDGDGDKDYHHHHHQRHQAVVSLVRQHSFDSSESRYYASPSLYMCGVFEPTEGYRKVAWPPVSDNIPIRSLTPQPQQTPQQTGQYYQRQHQTSHPHYSQQQDRGNSPQPQSRQQHQQQQHYQQQQTYQQRQQSMPSGDYSHQQEPQNYSRQESYTQQQRQLSQSQSHQQQRSYPQQQYQQQQHQQQQQQHHQYRQQQSYQQQESQNYSRQSSYPSQYQSSQQEQRPYSQQQHQQQPQYQPQQQQEQQNAYSNPASSSTVSFCGNVPNQYHQPSQQQHQQQQQQQQPYHSPVVSHQPSGHYQQPQHQQQSPQQYQQQQSQPQYNQSEPQYYNPQAQQQQYQQPQYQQQYQQQPQYQPLGGDRGQSPGIITLRKEVPISQRSAPVVQSQPAAASFGGGANMRGDLKWPPPEVKAQIALENEERIKLAKSPTFRPRRVNKDYSSFFAKHALNSTYPGYRVPPGTQHVYAQY